MDRLIAAEFFKLRKRMMTWVLALIMIGLVILLYSVLWSTSVRVSTFGERHGFTGFDLRRALFAPYSIPYALQMVGSFGAILAMILAAGSVGSEYAWGTIRVAATASSGRMRMIAAKLIVILAFVAFGTLLALAAAQIYGFIIAAYYGSASVDFVTTTFVRDQLASYGRTLLVMSPYAALAFAVAVIGRSTLAGVGSGLGVAFIEPIVGGLMDLGGSPWNDMPKYFLSTNRQVVMLQNKLPSVLPRIGGGGDGGPSGAFPPLTAELLLLGYTAAFICIALIVFRRRDIGSGQ